jgi:hypothetical protein
MSRDIPTHSGNEPLSATQEGRADEQGPTPKVYGSWQVFRVKADMWAAVWWQNENVYGLGSRHRSEAAAQKAVDRLNRGLA